MERILNFINNKNVWLIILVFVVMGILYSFSIPLWQPYDEPAHFYYVNYLADNHRLPVMSNDPGMLYEAHQPPLYYVLNSFFVLKDKSVAFQVHFLRIIAVIIGCGTIWLAWKVSEFIFKDNKLFSFLSVSIMALSPMFIAVNSTVTNDSLAIFFATAVILLAFKTIDSLASIRDYVFLGLFTGLALLTKAWNVYLIIGTLMLILYQGIAARKYKNMFERGLIFASIAIVVSGWWYMRSMILYGSPFGPSIALSGAGDTQLFSPSVFLLFWKGVFATYWFFYQFMRCDPAAHGPNILYVYFGIITLIAL